MQSLDNAINKIVDYTNAKQEDKTNLNIFINYIII